MCGQEAVLAFEGEERRAGRNDSAFEKRPLPRVHRPMGFRSGGPAERAGAGRGTVQEVSAISEREVSELVHAGIRERPNQLFEGSSPLA